MSVQGINQYVLENHEKDIYDFLMSSIVCPSGIIIGSTSVPLRDY